MPVIFSTRALCVIVQLIGRIFSSLNDALVRRLLKLAEQELGPPPCPYAWLVFGSEGRQEQALLTDQDNALVYAAESPAAKVYFGKLAEIVVDGLLRAVVDARETPIALLLIFPHRSLTGHLYLAAETDLLADPTANTLAIAVELEQALVHVTV